METGGIEIWNNLIVITISPSAFLNQKISEETFESFLLESTKAKNEMRSFLIREAFTRRSEQELELLIERYQIFIGRLLDTLYNYHEHKDITDELKGLYEKISHDLKDMMGFIETYFSKYFNVDERVPNTYLAAMRHEIKRQLPGIRKLLRAKDGNLQLIDCVLGIIKKFIEDVDALEYISYRSLIYMKNLLRELSQMGRGTCANDKYSPLMALLIYLNFNDQAFLKHIFTSFADMLSSLETLQDKIEELRLYHKQTCQMHTKPGVALHLNQASVKQTILAWLDEEILFWESGTREKTEFAVKAPVKINTSLAVPVLALFTRLFKEAGIITNHNQAEILRFVSTYFTSKRRIGISYGHLHSKFYQIEESTKRKVYDLLMEMAQLCRKMN